MPPFACELLLEHGSGPILKRLDFDTGPEVLELEG